MTRYAFTITRTDDDREEEDRVMSRGLHTLTEDEDPFVFAYTRLHQNRMQHSYYTGPRRVTYWPFCEDQPFRHVAPENAEYIDG